MSNRSSSSCPYCGAQLATAQHFCSNCGATVIVDNNQQATMSHGDENIYAQPGSASTFNPYAPSPPYVEPAPYVQQYQSTAGNYQTPQVPEYARPTKNSSKSVLMQIGCGFVVMILLILSLCVGGSILAVRWISTLPADSTPVESSPINYIHSSTNAFNQLHDPLNISRPITSTIATSEITYAQVNLSSSEGQQTINSLKFVQPFAKSTTHSTVT